MAVFCLFSIPLARAKELVLKVNGIEKKGPSLEAALAGVDLKQVRDIIIASGEVKAADWQYLRGKRDLMTALNSFIVNKEVTPVADIETGKNEPMQKPKDPGSGMEADEAIPSINGSPISSTCTYVEIHNLNKIALNSFSEVGVLEIAIFPDLTELGAFALANHTSLRVMFAPKLTKIGANAFYKCEALTLMRLGKTPPTLEKKKIKKPDPNNEGQTIEVEEEFSSVFNFLNENANPVLMPVGEDGTYLSEADFKTAKDEYLKVLDGRPNGKTWTGAIPKETDGNYNEWLATQADKLWYGWNVEPFGKIEIDPAIKDGVITTKPTLYQKAGGYVDIYASPSSGKGLKEVTYTTPSSTTPVKVIDETFKMPATDVKIFATFADKVLKGKITLHYKASDGTEKDMEHVREDAGSVLDLFRKGKGDDAYLDELKDEKGALDLSRVTSITITGGAFENSDWGWLKVNRVQLNHLKKFEITKDAETVASIKDNTDYEGVFYAGDHGALEEVILHKVKSIGSFSFISCTLLTKVVAPDCERLGDDAFETCQKLVDVQAPKVKKLGKEVFSGCRLLKKVSFPALESMAEPNPKIPDEIQLVSHAFLDCRSLESVDLGKVKLIPVRTFNGCLSLEEVKAPEVEVIGNAAFSDDDPRSTRPRCISLMTLTFPKVKRIGEFAFRKCLNLERLIVGQTPPMVGKQAFDSCMKQDMVLFSKEDGTILTSASEIAPVAAKYKAAEDGNQSDDKWFGWTIPTSQLYSLSMDPTTQNGSVFMEPIGYAPAGKKVVVTQLPDLGYALGTLTYNGGTAIENDTFIMPAADVKVKAVFPKNALTVSINNGAHVECTSLKEAIDRNYSGNYKEVKHITVVSGAFTTNEWRWLEANVTELYALESFTVRPGVVVADVPNVKNEQVFQGYLSLKAIGVIDIAGVKNVGSTAFQDSKENLTKLNLPDVVNIGTNSFYACEKLIEINAPNLEELGEGAFGNTFALTSISLPKAKKIGNRAFQSESAGSLGQSVRYGILANVNIPEVEMVGEDAFNSCQQLLSIDIPNLKDLRAAAFARCLNLDHVHFDLIDSVPRSAFYVCNKLTDFSFKSAKRIGSHAFASCIIPEIRDEMFPAVTEIGFDAFKDNIRPTVPVTGLASVTLSNVVKIDSGAFRLNSALTYVNFQALKDLGAKAFLNDGSLSTIIAPNLEKIGRWAFKGCHSLRTLAIGAKVPKVLANTEEDKLKTFECPGCTGRKLILLDQDGQTPLSGEKLDNAIASFKADEGWGKIANDTWYGWSIVKDKVLTVSLADNMVNGTVAGFPSFYPKGSEVSINFRPENYYTEKPGSLQVYKKGDKNTSVELLKDASGNTLRKFVMPDYDVEVYVEFQKAPFAVTVDQLFDGKIECEGIEKMSEVPWDTKVTLKFIPDQGFEPQEGTLKVVAEKDDKIEVEVDETNSFKMPKFNVKVSVKFQKETEKKITILPLEHGKIFASPALATSGVKIVLTILPENGYRLAAGSIKAYKKDEPETVVEVTKEGDDYTFTMPAFEVEITAKFELATGVEEDLLAQAIKAYPNPFADVIEIADASQVLSYSLYNVAGVRCLTGKNAGAASVLRIATKALPEGIYILQLEVRVAGQTRVISRRLEKGNIAR